MESRNTVRTKEVAVLRQVVPVTVRFGALCVAGLGPRHAVAFAIGETAIEAVLGLHILLGRGRPLE